VISSIVLKIIVLCGSECYYNLYSYMGAEIARYDNIVYCTLRVYTLPALMRCEQVSTVPSLVLKLSYGGQSAL